MPCQTLASHIPCGQEIFPHLNKIKNDQKSSDKYKKNDGYAKVSNVRSENVRVDKRNNSKAQGRKRVKSDVRDKIKGSKWTNRSSDKIYNHIIASNHSNNKRKRPHRYSAVQLNEHSRTKVRYSVGQHSTVHTHNDTKIIVV